MYERGAASGEKVVNIHLFGIKYAAQLRGMSVPEIAARADISPTYVTEIHKGMKLAKYVRTL